MKKELNELLWKHFENPNQRDMEFPLVDIITSSAFDKVDFMAFVTLLGDSFLDYVESIKNYGENGINVTIFKSKAEELKKQWESDIISKKNTKIESR